GGKPINIQNVVVCSKHFKPEDFESESNYAESPLTKRIHKPHAIPRKLPGCGYLSKPSTTPRSSKSLSENRLAKSNQDIWNLNNNLMLVDEVPSLDDLKGKLDSTCISSKIYVQDLEESFEFIYLIHTASVENIKLQWWLGPAVLIGAPVILYDCSSTFRYYTRISLYYLSLSTVSSVLIPIVAFRPRDVHNMVIGARIMRWISSKLLGLRYHIQPNPHLARDQTYMIVVNHQHSIDVLGLFEMWPVMGKCTTLAKRSLLYFSGPFGLMAWLSGTTFINRDDKVEARNILADTVLKSKESNIKVLVFPEGTRNHTPGQRDLLAFRRGAFAAAIQAQVPILPVVISHYESLDTRHRILEPADIKIHVLEPFETEDVEGAKPKKLFCNSSGGGGNAPGRPGTGTIGPDPPGWPSIAPCLPWDLPHRMVIFLPLITNLLKVSLAAVSASDLFVYWTNAQPCFWTTVMLRTSPNW
ncbi:hypothetical protein TCAL_09799, partial [Tigriopus californicus]